MDTPQDRHNAQQQRLTQNKPKGIFVDFGLILIYLGVFFFILFVLYLSFIVSDLVFCLFVLERGGTGMEFLRILLNGWEGSWMSWRKREHDQNISMNFFSIK